MNPRFFVAPSRYRSRVLPALFLLAAFGPTPACAPRNPQPGHHHAVHSPTANRDPHGPADLAAYIAHLESPDRDAWQKPDDVVAAFRLSPTDWVADVGSGPGYFALRLARAVPAGLVFAVDVEPRQLDRLNEHISAEGLRNVVPVLAVGDDPRLPVERFDLILVVNTYHHFPNRVRYLQRLREALRGNGRLVIIDYWEGELPIGPPPDHKLPRARVIQEATEAGFHLIEEPRFLPYQYFLVFAGPESRGEPRGDRQH